METQQLSEACKLARESAGFEGHHPQQDDKHSNPQGVDNIRSTTTNNSSSSGSINPSVKMKNDKMNRNTGGGGGGGGGASGCGNNNKFHQFRTPQSQYIQQKKKMWNKRQKCHHPKHPHIQQQVISKADLENIQNIRNQMGHRGNGGGGGNSNEGSGGCGGGGGGNAQQGKNLKQQMYKKMLVNRSCGVGIGGIGNGGINGAIGSTLFGARSKFFLPDKRPRKEIMIPPTKFLLGGNISDPLNLNSLQDEAINSNNSTPATTPRQSPITTPPKVEVIIPPNIHDPLHLLDPVDSMEYEKQLTSPMKRKSKSKHRNRKKKPKRRRLESTNSVSSSCYHTTGTADEDERSVSMNATVSTDASDSFNQSTGGVVVDSLNVSVAASGGCESSANSDDDISTTTSTGKAHRKLSCGEFACNAATSTSACSNVECAATTVTSTTCTSVACANARRSLDREKATKDLRLDLSLCAANTAEPNTSNVSAGVGSTMGGGRKRKISEGPGSAKNKFRRMDSMDKIVSPVVPQPGAWKRPPRLVPTGARKISRNRSTSVSETELLSPVDEAKSIDSSVRADTPEDDVKPSAEKATSADGKASTSQSQAPKFRPDGYKYQYGNYDRYPGYRHLNEFMDVRLQVFQRNPDLFRGKDILDVGCNVGHMTIAVARNLAPKSILGIDIDKTLIEHARRNLSMFVRKPLETEVAEDTKKPTVESSKAKRNKKKQRQKWQDDHKNKLYVENDELFPISFPICYGGIPAQPPPETQLSPAAVSGDQSMKNDFPKNVFFRQTNYVLKDEALLNNDSQQYDVIMCLSVTKWIHLNFGDAGLKLAFKRMFNQLRPGGKLILEAQNWASYKKKKNLTETIYQNYRNIEFFPNKFHEYLLSNDVGFSHSYTLGVPRHLSKGFCRPIQLYAKGDFTPNHIQWSDTYHPQTPYEAYRGIYATIPPRPAYPLWGSVDTPRTNHGSYSCRQTPMYQPTSHYYNPMETDSYLPSYDTKIHSHYLFASPLYQTVWSPPAHLRNSSSHTPVFGSVREADLEEGGHRHVYPPSTDETSSPNANGAFNSIREADVEDPNSPGGNRRHVYANCDSSMSPQIIDNEIVAEIDDAGGGSCYDPNNSSDKEN